MPFVTPPPHRRDGIVEWAWDGIPHRRHLISGDALFVEEGRADGALLFLLLDVMGHGEEAASIVHRFRRFYLWDEATQERQPLELLLALTSLIAPHCAGSADLSGLEQEAAKERFTAALAVLIEPTTGEARMAMAGLPAPWLSDRDGSRRTLRLRGTPLGIAELPEVPGKPPFGEAALTLNQHDHLFAWTDGLLDARPLVEEEESLPPSFEKAGLRQALTTLSPAATTAQQLAELFRSAQSYAGAAWPCDDTTALLWRIVPDGE